MHKARPGKNKLAATFVWGLDLGMCPAGSQSIVTDLATVTPTVLANCKSGRFLSNLSGSTCLVCLVTREQKNKNQTW